jgi:hypothetical protein
MNITIILLLLSILGLTFLYFLKKGSAERKENLNIVKEGNRLHFFLSDDHFFSIKLEKEKIDNIIIKRISNEVESIKRSIREISFINFQNDRLENRLNKILE